MIERLLPPANSLPAVVTLVLGVVMLLGGGYWLVEGAVRLARRLGQSTLMIGLTVVAFGTSAPELAFNLISAVKGSPGLSFGNVVGSNITNIALVLGLSALVRPLIVHGQVVRRELPILIAVSLLTLVLAWLPFTRAAGGDAAFTRLDGLLMLLLFAFVAWQWVRSGKQSEDSYAKELEEDLPAPRTDSLPVALTHMVVGIVSLVAGADLMEMGATDAARALGVTDAVIGLTIVALATSLPEVATSVVAARRGHGDLAVGNVIGSNLFNICLVLGATCAIAPVPVPAFGGWDMLIMLALTLFLVPVSITSQGRIVLWEGIVLVGSYVAFVAFTLLR